jgi:hypothetical protein
MKTAANRVLLAFKTRDERKKEIEPLLKGGTTDERTLTGLKLEHLRQAKHRLNQMARPDEKPFMAFLNNHIAKLEKQLYPNLWQRLFFRIKDQLFDGPIYLKQLTQQRAANMESLKTQLREAGLCSITGKLENHLEADQQKICLPLDCQLFEGKALNFELHFEKDPYGNFQLHRLDGSLLQDGKLVRSQEFKLDDWPNLGTNQVWSLLEGRAMKQTYTNASGHESQRWVELGPNGARHYDPNHDFDVKTLVAGMPAIMGSKPELIRYLENGQSAPIQADPANQTLKFFDEKNKPVRPEQLNQRAEKLGPHVKTFGAPVQRMRKGVKNGHRI